MGIKRCMACGDLLPLSSRVPNQSYCARTGCQRERRRLWQRERRQSDETHRDRKANAQKRWQQDNPDYWRQYRDRHPDYAEQNRAAQRKRNAARREPEPIAKKNASAPALLLNSGTYRLMLDEPEGVAKKNALIVKITVLTAT